MATTDAAPAGDGLPGGGGVYEYVDDQPRTYQFADGTVITPQRGDVCAIPYDPGDGRWSKSKAKPTRLPDNHPDQIPLTQAAAAQQRAQTLAADPAQPDAAPTPGDTPTQAADAGKAAS
ncbi:MAG TPA: hypothetical protein VN088_19055 [Nocardioides sp.]|nr:hypothetical protein [Nocardioides sp.]